MGAFAVLFSTWVVAGPTIQNFDFSQGTKQWQGQGFVLSRSGELTSKNAARGLGLLYRTFTVPEGTGTLHFRAGAVSEGNRSDRHLDVYLEAAGRRIIPKQLKTANGYRSWTSLLPVEEDSLREYMWPVADYQGRTVRIVIVDNNPREGHFVQCSGFSLREVNALQKELIRKEMRALTTKHRLTTMSGYSSPHFMAYSNAGEKFTIDQLKRCELLYGLFFDHFRTKGFSVHRPTEKMMVTIFDSQKGFEACLGWPVPSTITGLYHLKTNRLVVYDYGNNRALKAHEAKGQKTARQAGSDLQKMLVSGALIRKVDSIRSLANISTIMHETAHQLSFNCGLISRNRDVPLWLAEGLACYCEATEKGAWKGIGKLNPVRLQTLAKAMNGKSKLLPVQELLQGDTWFRGPQGRKNAAVGYAQSWALFRMLMEEQPRSFRLYLDLISKRRTDDHRMADFVEIFGSNLKQFDKRHREYIQEMVRRASVR